MLFFKHCLMNFELAGFFVKLESSIFDRHCDTESRLFATVTQYLSLQAQKLRFLAIAK